MGLGGGSVFAGAPHPSSVRHSSPVNAIRKRSYYLLAVSSPESISEVRHLSIADPV